MFNSCCEAPPASSATEEIAQADSQSVPQADKDKQEEAPAVVVETPAEPEQPAVTKEEVVEVVTETPAPKDEPIPSVPIPSVPITSVADVVVEEQAKPAASDEPAAKTAPATSKLEALFQAGMWGVKLDGITVLEVEANGQAGKAGVKKGHKIVTYGGQKVPEDATAVKQSEWVLEKLKSAPRPVLVQFERLVLEATIAAGTLGLKMKGRTVIEVTPGLQTDTAGVKVGCDLLSFGAEVVPSGKTDAQLAEWLQIQLAAPRPIVVQFEQP